MIKELRNRARDVLLTQAIASEESLESTDAGRRPAELLEGMSPDLALRWRAAASHARGSRRAGGRRPAGYRGPG
jgi:hypothetical protein